MSAVVVLRLHIFHNACSVQCLLGHKEVGEVHCILWMKFEIPELLDVPIEQTVRETHKYSYLSEVIQLWCPYIPSVLYHRVGRLCYVGTARTCRM